VFNGQKQLLAFEDRNLKMESAGDGGAWRTREEGREEYKALSECFGGERRLYEFCVLVGRKSCLKSGRVGQDFVMRLVAACRSQRTIRELSHFPIFAES